MRAEAGLEERVLNIRTSLPKLAARLREYLQLAGVSRAELFVEATDRTRKALTFHDLRATGITWMAIRGDDPLKISQRAGHAGFATTAGYIREAEAIRDGFGDVFPSLPPALSGGGPIAAFRPAFRPAGGAAGPLAAAISQENPVELRGIEPQASRMPAEAQGSLRRDDGVNAVRGGARRDAGAPDRAAETEGSAQPAEPDLSRRLEEALQRIAELEAERPSPIAGSNVVPLRPSSRRRS
jgi:hypothetical protein